MSVKDYNREKRSAINRAAAWTLDRAPALILLGTFAFACTWTFGAAGFVLLPLGLVAYLLIQEK